MGKKVKRREKSRTSSILISSAYSTIATALFALICPAVVVAAVITYAHFVRSSSVDIEWNMFAMLADPLGLLVCAVVWAGVFVWKLYR